MLSGSLMEECWLVGELAREVGVCHGDRGLVVPVVVAVVGDARTWSPVAMFKLTN